MSIENAVRNKALLIERLGKSALNVKYPREFELYVVALELVDGDGNTLKYFIFPVNPSSLDEVDPKLTNIKKTLAGVVSLSTTTFIPGDVTLSGNFGRKFKILLGGTFTSLISSFATQGGKVTLGSVKDGFQEFFDERIKTGYGCFKILEEIVEAADVVDDKGPRRLIWHNLAFGTAYLVKPISLRKNMTQDTNMIHNYFLQLKTIAPLDVLKAAEKNEEERLKLSTTAYVQTQTDRLVNGLTKIFN
jgi:hypothetical protein